MSEYNPILEESFRQLNHTYQQTLTGMIDLDIVSVQCVHYNLYSSNLVDVDHKPL